jgi:hypothetical protein
MWTTCISLQTLYSRRSQYWFISKLSKADRATSGRLIYNFEKKIKVDNMYTIANFVVQPIEPGTRPMYNINWAENCKTKQPTKKLEENRRDRKNPTVRIMSFYFYLFFVLGLCPRSFLFFLFNFSLNKF